MDEADPVLRRAIGFTVVQILAMRMKRGRIASDGKWKGVRGWAIRA